MDHLQGQHNNGFGEGSTHYHTVSSSSSLPSSSARSFNSVWGYSQSSGSDEGHGNENGNASKSSTSTASTEHDHQGGERAHASRTVTTGEHDDEVDVGEEENSYLNYGDDDEDNSTLNADGDADTLINIARAERDMDGLSIVNEDQNDDEDDDGDTLENLEKTDKDLENLTLDATGTTPVVHNIEQAAALPPTEIHHTKRRSPGLKNVSSALMPVESYAMVEQRSGSKVETFATTRGGGYSNYVLDDDIHASAAATAAVVHGHQNRTRHGLETMTIPHRQFCGGSGVSAIGNVGSGGTMMVPTAAAVPGYSNYGLAHDNQSTLGQDDYSSSLASSHGGEGKEKGKGKNEKNKYKKKKKQNKRTYRSPRGRTHPPPPRKHHHLHPSFHREIVDGGKSVADISACSAASLSKIELIGGNIDTSSTKDVVTSTGATDATSNIPRAFFWTRRHRDRHLDGSTNRRRRLCLRSVLSLLFPPEVFADLPQFIRVIVAFAIMAMMGSLAFLVVAYHKNRSIDDRISYGTEDRGSEHGDVDSQLDGASIFSDHGTAHTVGWNNSEPGKTELETNVSLRGSVDQYNQNNPLPPITVGVYYYPWYTSTNNFHGGKYVRSNLIPRQIPMLGEYSSNDVKTIQRHVEWSAEANVGLWVTSWWGPNSVEDLITRTVILETLTKVKQGDDHTQKTKITEQKNLRMFGGNAGNEKEKQGKDEEEHFADENINIRIGSSSSSSSQTKTMHIALHYETKGRLKLSLENHILSSNNENRDQNFTYYNGNNDDNDVDNNNKGSIKNNYHENDGSSWEEIVASDLRFITGKYFSHPNYYRIDNKPVLFIYLARLLNQRGMLSQFVDVVRATVRQMGQGEIYLVGDVAFRSPKLSNPLSFSELKGEEEFTEKEDPSKILDAVTNYDVYGAIVAAKKSDEKSEDPDHEDGKKSIHFSGREGVDKYFQIQEQWRRKAAAHSILEKQCDFLPSVSPGFNDRGVRVDVNHPAMSRKLNGEHDEFGSLFRYMLQNAAEQIMNIQNDYNVGGPEIPQQGPATTRTPPFLIMVNSWNEFHEDTQIEPIKTEFPNVNTQTTNDLSDSGKLYTQGLEYGAYDKLYLDILREETTNTFSAATFPPVVRESTLLSP